MTNRSAVRSTIVIVGAVVTLFAFAAAIAIAAEFGHGLSSNSTPVVTTVLGLIGAAVPALLALVKAEKSEQIGHAVNHKVDGQLKRLADEAQEANRRAAAAETEAGNGGSV